MSGGATDDDPGRARGAATVDEALQRARTHARNATLESLEAARAMLEATLLAADIAPGATDTMVGRLQRQLQELISAMRANAAFVMPRSLAKPLSDAIDAEIKRWEVRSHTDADARLVLRAFLGVRELLWEVSKPPAKAPPASRSSPRTRRSEPTAANHTNRTDPTDRVQRFKIED